MNVEIITANLELNVYGYAGNAIDKDYAGTAFRLMDRMWKTVRSHNLQNKGLNIWIYDENEWLFAGVELSDNPAPDTGLEQKRITLKKYAYYKHIGPYNLIASTGRAMENEVRSRGFEITNPYIEIYGHWNSDETKLETELLMSLK